MITRQGKPFYQVGVIIDLFIQMGCEIRVAEPTIETPEGERFSVRYLFNPANKAFAPLVDLDDDEHISLSEIQSFERRLGVSIPLPP